MFHLFGTDRRLLAAAGALAFGSLALLDTASASAQNLATCQLQAHITLSDGAFSSEGSSSAGCTGLISGALAGSLGSADAYGSYTGDPCSMGSWRGIFDAQVPKALYLIDPQYAQLSGSFQLMDVGRMLVVSGSGSVDGQPVSYGGTGSFTPDSGCRSGVLTEQLVVLDGASGQLQQAARGATTTTQGSVIHRRHRYHGRRHHHHAS